MTIAGTKGRNLRSGHLDFRDHRHQAQKINRSVDPVKIVIRETKSLKQLVGDVCRAIRLDFQADSITATPFPQLKLDRFQQIVGFFLVEVEIAIPGYAKLVSTLDFHAMEE